MENFKFRINSQNTFNRIIAKLISLFPDIYVPEDLKYNQYTTRYMYLQGGTLYTGYNNHAFDSSPSILGTQMNLLMAPVDSGFINMEQHEKTMSEFPLGTIKYPDIMLDLETLGTRPGFVILSIGAVAFNMETGGIGPKFHSVIDLKDSTHAGFRIDTDTLKWWMAQKYEALKENLGLGGIKPESISQVLIALSKWANDFSNVEDVKIWGNSARFDLGMLEPYFERIGQDPFWHHRNEKDVRTLVGFAPHIKEAIIKDAEGNITTKHTPVHDCMDQIEYCTAIFSKIKIDE